MSILRVTVFRWGATINSWYRDMAAAERQLATEVGRVKDKDVIHEEWYECTRVPAPKVNVEVTP